MQIKGAIFDMDGTLVDSLTFWENYWKEFGIRYFDNGDFQCDETLDRSVRTMIFREAVALIYQRYELPETEEEFYAYSASGVDEFYRTKAPLKEGAAELLADLKARGIKICLASATNMRWIRLALDCLDLAKYFDCVLSCADIGVGKDRPDIYLHALKAMEMKPEEACVFEDSYVALETAKAIGCHTVGIFDRNNYEQERLRRASEIYVEEGDPLTVLIHRIER